MQHSVRRVVTSTPPYATTRLASSADGRVLLTCRPGVVLEAKDSGADAPKVVVQEDVVACPKPELAAMV